MTIQQVPSRGRISIAKIQNFTMHRRKSVTKILYGGLLMMFAVLLASLDPLPWITTWIMTMKEGSFVFNVWKEPPYKLQTEVWIFNYTNLPEFIAGTNDTLKLQEIGPFTFRELRTNEEMVINEDTGILRFKPETTLTYLPEESAVANLSDMYITVPNIALLAVSTLAADKLNYFGNAGAYYSIQALGSKLYRNLTVDQFLWGYHDPIVTVANNILPGWIDFGKIGILDRFYGLKTDSVEVNIRDPSKMYSIHTWDDSAGLPQRGYSDWNSSIPCQRVKGAYEGIMVSPNMPEEQVLPVFRKQACRVYPFTFHEITKGAMGFNFRRYHMAKDSFSKTSPYNCTCSPSCLPEGFIDISDCYYGFPITLSKPHFMDADPRVVKTVEGLKPDLDKHLSKIDIEPNYGVPLAIYSNVQVNLAVRTSLGNPMTSAFKDKILPLVWISLYCHEPSPDVVTLLKLRFVIAPVLFIVFEVLLFIIGLVLFGQGLYSLYKPRYKIIATEYPVETRRKKSSTVIPVNIADNYAFDPELEKQAVALLSQKESDDDRFNHEYSDLIIDEDTY